MFRDQKEQIGGKPVFPSQPVGPAPAGGPMTRGKVDVRKNTGFVGPTQGPVGPTPRQLRRRAAKAEMLKAQGQRKAMKRGLPPVLGDGPIASPPAKVF